MLCCLDLWGQATEHRFFGHLEADVVVGTLGVGMDFSLPLCRSLSVRLGFVSQLPFQQHGSMEVNLNGQSQPIAYDADGHRTDRMGKVIALMQSFAGYEVSDRLNLCHESSFWNGRLLLDWYPTAQRNWRVTAGFMVGPSMVARIVNVDADMSMLTGMCMYNSMYENIVNGDPILTLGSTTVGFPTVLRDKVRGYGQMTMPAGQLQDGSPFYFYPGEDGLAQVRVKTHSVRPYLGVGYTCWLDSDQRTALAFDLGCAFWGGKPQMLTTGIRRADTVSDEGVTKTHYERYQVDLQRDMLSVDGGLKRWTDFYAKLPVIPVLELRFCRRLF